MSEHLALRPLASWEPFLLRLDRDLLVEFTCRLLQRRGAPVEEVQLEGQGDQLILAVRVRWHGLTPAVRVKLEELQLVGGFLGCRLVQVQGPLGLGLPNLLLGVVLKRLPIPASWDHKEKILLVDLRGVLPAGLALEVRRVHLRGPSLELYLGPGRWVPPSPVIAEETEVFSHPLGI
ncbi:MAG: hypothetical protein N2447_02725 [Thermoanaerobaculum sp.]|nr:hypothetical protein [Thermoanaerobaculum sp.]